MVRETANPIEPGSRKVAGFFRNLLWYNDLRHLGGTGFVVSP